MKEMASLFDRCGVGVARLDALGVVRHANRVFARLLGVGDACSQQPEKENEGAQGAGGSGLSGRRLTHLLAIPPDLDFAITHGLCWRGDVARAAAPDHQPGSPDWPTALPHTVGTGGEAVWDSGMREESVQNATVLMEVFPVRALASDSAQGNFNGGAAMRPLAASAVLNDAEAGVRQDYIGGVLMLVRSAECGSIPASSLRFGRSMRRFASGISHEFNNVLASIQGFAEIAESVGADDESMRSLSLRNILRGCGQARETVARARIMGGRVDLTPGMVNLTVLVARWCAGLSGSLPAGVRLETDFSPVPDCLADASFLRLAFDSLWENSVGAMGGQGALRIMVRHSGDSHWPVLLEVRDSGCGMSEAVLARCTEPYFTTREAAGKKGRGLALVQGIVWAHGGRVAAATVAGQGTVVRLWLPVEKG